MWALVHAIVFGAVGASELVSLEGARTERMLAPFLGAYASPDDHDRATVTLTPNGFEMWQSEGDDAEPIRALTLTPDMVNQQRVRWDYSSALGWFITDRLVELKGPDLFYSEVHRGWFRQVIERWMLHRTPEGLEFTRQREFAHWDMFRMSWSVDREAAREGVRSFNWVLPLVRLSTKPIPVDEFRRARRRRPTSAPLVPPQPPPDRRGVVLPFPPRPGCARQLDERVID